MPADSLLRWCARTYWRWLVVGVLAAIGWRACMFAIAFAVGQAVDQGLERDDHTATAWWAGIALGTAGLLALFDATRHWCADIGYYEVLADVRRRLYSHVQSLDPRWHAHHGVGEVLGYFNADAPQIAVLLGTGPVFISAIVTLLGTSALMFLVDVRLALIASTCLIPVTIASLLAGPVIHRGAGRLQSGTARLTESIEESFEGIVAVKALGLERARLGDLEAVSEAVVRSARSFERSQASLVTLSALVPALATGAALWWGGRLVAQGTMGLGELVAFISWMALYVGIITTIIWHSSEVIRIRVAAARVEGLFRERSTLIEPSAPMAVPSAGTLAVIHGSLVNDDDPVLGPLSLTVPFGQRVAVIGESGAGKTALLRLLARRTAPSAGEVTLDGVPLAAMPLEALRRAVVLVDDQPFLFRASVRDNVAFLVPGATDIEVWTALQLAHAREVVEELPSGLATLLGAGGRELSGGQRQRLALARALLARPDVLLLDDSFSALDAPTEAAVWVALREWPGTIVCATHRLEAVEGIADRVIELDRGAIVADRLLPGRPQPQHVEASREASQ